MTGKPSKSQQGPVTGTKIGMERDRCTGTQTTSDYHTLFYTIKRFPEIPSVPPLPIGIMSILPHIFYLLVNLI